MGSELTPRFGIPEKLFKLIKSPKKFRIQNLAILLNGIFNNPAKKRSLLFCLKCLRPRQSAAFWEEPRLDLKLGRLSESQTLALYLLLHHILEQIDDKNYGLNFNYLVLPDDAFHPSFCR